MATPASFPDHARETAHLKDEKVALAYEEGHDADFPTEVESHTPPQHASSNLDVEKGTESNARSAHSEERTSDKDAPAAENISEARDPHIVDWDGDDDPENPLNWSTAKKWNLIAVLAAVTLVTYVFHILHSVTIH
jgi:hypothetical protein